jgi:hypothetical protein
MPPTLFPLSVHDRMIQSTHKNAGRAEVDAKIDVFNTLKYLPGHSRNGFWEIGLELVVAFRLP